jgi:hypothetical protein
LVIEYLFTLAQSQLGKNLPLLAIFKDDSKAKLIADRYINGLNDKAMYLKQNISLLADFTRKSDDKGFDFFYRHSKQIDKIMNSKDFALSLVLNVIVDEEYNKFFSQAIKNQTDNIPWQKIFQSIKQKYNEAIAERLNISLKQQLYGNLAQKQDKYWSPYIDYYIMDVERYELDTTVQNGFRDATMLNNFVYNVIFFNSNNSNHIATGLKWMEGVLRRNPDDCNSMDTYANLLYKANRVSEAIFWQEKAVKTAINQNNKWKLPSFQAKLEKMKRGEPTWIKEK